MVTGAVGAMAYGEPRLTGDVDVLIELAPGDAGRFHALFDRPELYVPPLEVIVAVAEHRHGERQLNVILPGEALKADFYVVSDDLDRWGLERRRREPMGSEAIWVAPAEYTIVRKLEFYRAGESAKHVDDIRSMLRTRPDAVDLGVLEGLVADRGLGAQWDQVRRRGRPEGRT
jgi:hypothetical protein